MIGMFDSPRAFEAYATIEAGYFILEKMRKHNTPKNAVEASIDIATGYAVFRDIALAKNAIDVMEDIIEAKEFIGADARPDKDFLATLNAFLRNNAQA